MYFLYNGKFGGCEHTPTAIKKETNSFNIDSFNDWHISLNWGKICHLVKESFPYLKVSVHQYGLVLKLGNQEYFVTSSDAGLDWLSNDSEFLNYAFLPFVKEELWKKENCKEKILDIPNSKLTSIDTNIQNSVNVTPITENLKVIKKEKKELEFTPKMLEMYKLLEKSCNESNFYFNDYIKMQLNELLKDSISKKYSKSLSHEFTERFYNIILSKAPKCTSTNVGMDFYIFGAFDTSFCMYQTGLNFVTDNCKYKVRVKNWDDWSIFIKAVMPTYIKYLENVQVQSKKFGGYDIINAFGKTALEKKAELSKLVPVVDDKSVSDLNTSLIDSKLTTAKYKNELDREASKLEAKHEYLLNKKKELEEPEFKQVVTVNYADVNSEMYKWYRARVELMADYLRSLEGITKIDINYSMSTTSIYLFVTGKNDKTIRLSIRDHGNLHNKKTFVILVRGFNLNGVHNEILELLNTELGIETEKEYIENKKSVFLKYLKVRKVLANKKKKKDSSIDDDLDNLDVMEGAC